MSEHSVVFRVTTPADTFANFRLLIEGMCCGECGAYIEERIECFGDSAELSAEKMLDEWEEGWGIPQFSDFRFDRNCIKFSMVDGNSIVENANLLKALLETCGATVVLDPHYNVDVDDQ